MATTGTVGKSGNKLADGVLSGYEWTGGTITYAFPTLPSDYAYSGEKGNGFAAVNADIANGARFVLDQQFDSAANDGFSVEGFTNLVVNVGSNDAADIRFAESKSANPSAYAYLPAGGGEKPGDVWFGKNPIYDAPVVGNYAFATILHETGHALGLKHGHEAASFDRIKTELKGKYDSHEYSVMTYHSYPGVKANFYTNEELGYPQTFMMADIRALQHMYGADFTTNGGNTIYSWDNDSGETLVNGVAGITPGANRIFATIWDGDGIDTYDLSAYETRVVVDLRPGKYSVFSQNQLADLDGFRPGKLANGNIYNALQFQQDARSLIENAIGGSGNDRLTGNAANNLLTGNAGADTFVYRKNSNADTIADFGIGADLINVVSFNIKNYGKLDNLMTEGGGGVTIDFGGGDTLFINGATILGLEKADFIL